MDQSETVEMLAETGETGRARLRLGRKLRSRVLTGISGSNSPDAGRGARIDSSGLPKIKQNAVTKGGRTRPEGTHPEHLPKVGVPEAEGNVGDV